MDQETDEFADFVEHPRYGRQPRLTRVVAKVLESENFTMRSRCGSGAIYENTAIEADTKLQLGASYYTKYYFDEKKQCIDCNRPFIFFAEEQKFWFDTLGISLNASGNHCFECRKIHNEPKRNKRRYDELFHNPKRSKSETNEMANISLGLLEQGQFHPQQAQTVRMLLNSLAREKSSEAAEIVTRNRKRLKAYEELVEQLLAEVDIDMAGIPDGDRHFKVRRFHRLAEKLQRHALFANGRLRV